MILVVDYGMGNLRSVAKALEHLGASVKVSASPRDIESADKVVLPGVGAFGDAAQELERLQLADPLRAFLQTKKPFLGICLGLQLLFPQSDESQGVAGLGILSGKVQLFRNKEIKIPHMGWNSVSFQKKHPLLRGIPDSSYFYFVHSYYAVPEKKDLVIGTAQHGETFAAILGGESFFATQFHPEKSQSAGLAILKNFLAWSP